MQQQEQNLQANEFLQRRFYRMKNIIDEMPLEKYYGLQSNNNEKITISLLPLDDVNDELIVLINFTKKPIAYNFNLPIEIIRDIASYDDHYIQLKIKIKYPNMYPFEPPVWSLLDVKSKINTHIGLKEYYEYIIDNHNNQNSGWWSSAINIEKDLLLFLTRINHFEWFL